MNQPRVVAFVPDLMDRSRLARLVGIEVATVSDPARLTEVVAAGDVVLVDLGRPGVLVAVTALAYRGVPVVGFASHVDAELLAAARDAGCRHALPRSALFANPARWLVGPDRADPGS